MWIEMDLLTNFALVLLNFASIIQRQDPILKSPDENIEAKSSAKDFMPFLAVVIVFFRVSTSQFGRLDRSLK